MTNLCLMIEWRKHHQRSVGTTHNCIIFKPRNNFERNISAEAFPFQCDVRHIDCIVELEIN
jgi:hypothetical protein